MNSNYLQFFMFTLLYISSAISSVHSDSKSKNGQLFLDRFKIPEKTPEPININTKKTKKIDLPPLTLVAGLLDKVTVVNTGKSVEAIIDEPISSSKAFSGVLLNDTYYFKKIRMRWASNATGGAGSTIDHMRAAIESVAIFVNFKYGTFDNAIKYRDGLAQVYFCIKVGSIVNPLFSPFGNVLRKIRKAGSSVKFTLSQTFQWFNYPVVAPNVVYYAYPGSYTDEETGRVYYCATTIIYPPELVAPISIFYSQFSTTFLLLRNEAGKRYSNQVPQYPRNVPVVEARGVVQPILPK